MNEWNVNLNSFKLNNSQFFSLYSECEKEKQAQAFAKAKRPVILNKH